MSSPTTLVLQSESDLQLSGRSAVNTPACSELQVQEELEEIAAAIQQGREEQETIQSIRNLNLTGFKVAEWKARSCSLNLCQLAVVHGQSTLVGYLVTEWRGFLKKALYLNSCDVSSQSTPVLTACSDASPVVNQTQTDSHKEDVDAIMINHPLHLACWLGHIHVLRSLTKQGVRVSSAKIEGDRGHNESWQYDMKRQELQELMRSASTIIIASTNKFQTPPRGLPVELAVSAQSVSCLKHLLAKVFVHATVSRQYSHQCMEVKRKAVALYLACCLSASQAVTLLLPELTTEDVVQCVDGRGQTPLHFAVWTGETHTIRLLLEKGALVNARVNTAASCFHILYRSHLQPWNYEANTRLLLHHGARVNVSTGSQDSPPDSASLQGTVSPLYALLEELMDATAVGCPLRDAQRRGRMDEMAEGLWMYTQSQEPVMRNFSLRDYLTCLVNSLRLLLEAGANPNLLLPDSTGDVKTALELVITSTRDRLALQAPDVFFAVLSLLIDFTTREVGINFYRHVAKMATRNASLRIGVINLFLDNGYGADAICQNMLYRCMDHTPGDMLYPCVLLVVLAHRASIRGLAALKRVSLFQKVVNQDLTEALSPLLGSPVPSLRYTCKLAVLQQLRWRGSRVESLPLPTPVKSYLQEHDYN